MAAKRRKRPLQSLPFGLKTQPSTAAVPREKRSLMQGAAIFWGWTAAVRGFSAVEKPTAKVAYTDTAGYPAACCGVHCVGEIQVETRAHTADPLQFCQLHLPPPKLINESPEQAPLWGRRWPHKIFPQ
jgi:hypothetical protein